MLVFSFAVLTSIIGKGNFDFNVTFYKKNVEIYDSMLIA